MNFDLTSYVMARLDRMDERAIRLEQTLENEVGSLSQRVASVEQSLQWCLSGVQRLSYIALPALILVLNLAPEETVALIKALVPIMAGAK